MKLVGTRIRVEKSDVKTEYFPEYCLEEKAWGNTKNTWYTVNGDSSHSFGEAFCLAESSTSIELTQGKETWAKFLIDQALWDEKQKEKINLHEQTKETSYIKYP